MRILYLCNYYHRAMIFRDAMDQLENRGNFVLAFNSAEQGDVIDTKYEKIMDDKVIHVECYSHKDRYIYFWKQHKIYISLNKHIKVDEFDIVHSHTLFNGGWAAMKLNKRFGIPFVVSVRNTDMNDYLKLPIFIPIAKKIARKAKEIVFLSETYRDMFLEKCFSNAEKELIKEKCHIIYNGLESFWLENKGQPKERVHMPLRLICVGKIDKNKNMEKVLEAAKLLISNGVETELTIIGQIIDPDIKAKLEKDSIVKMIPFLKKEELINYYRKADIFVMPSHYESFGRVYAEAMTQGLPVVYTRGQGFDGIFSEGTVGYSVNDNDASEIANRINDIIKNYVEISRNCLEGSDLFDWRTIAEELETIYK